MGKNLIFKIFYSYNYSKMSSNYKRGKKSKCGSVKDIPQVKYVRSEEDPSLSLERLLKFPKRKWKWDLISSHPN